MPPAWGPQEGQPKQEPQFWLKAGLTWLEASQCWAKAFKVSVRCAGRGGHHTDGIGSNRHLKIGVAGNVMHPGYKTCKGRGSADDLREGNHCKRLTNGLMASCAPC